MFTIEKKVGDDWVEASTHTLEVDALNQLEIFVAQGISPEDLRVV